MTNDHPFSPRTKKVRNGTIITVLGNGLNNEQGFK